MLSINDLVYIEGMLVMQLKELATLPDNHHVKVEMNDVLSNVRHERSRYMNIATGYKAAKYVRTTYESEGVLAAVRVVKEIQGLTLREARDKVLKWAEEGNWRKPE